MGFTAGISDLEVKVLKIFGQVIFIGHADPDNAGGLQIHHELNKLTVNAVEHHAIVLVHDGIDERPFLPHLVSSLA